MQIILSVMLVIGLIVLAGSVGVASIAAVFSVLKSTEVVQNKARAIISAIGLFWISLLVTTLVCFDGDRMETFYLLMWIGGILSGIAGWLLMSRAESVTIFDRVDARYLNTDIDGRVHLDHDIEAALGIKHQEAFLLRFLAGNSTDREFAGPLVGAFLSVVVGALASSFADSSAILDAFVGLNIEIFGALILVALWERLPFGPGKRIISDAEIEKSIENG